MKKLYIGNLSYDASEEALQTWFAEAGFQVLSVALIRDKFSNELRGFGFVEISDDKEADRAIQELNGKDFRGRPLTINEARPKREGDRGGGRGGPRKSRPRW